MLATGWHNGMAPLNPAGYGIKFLARDRDAFFHPEWDSVVLDLEGSEPEETKSVTLELTPSFWRACSEIRSAEIGGWLISGSAAPWKRGDPPGIVVRNIGGSRFSAQIKPRSVLPGLRGSASNS